MSKPLIEPICIKFSVDVTEYLRNELSLSEMTIYANHVASCDTCRETLKFEKMLDNDILGAEQKDIFDNEPDAFILEKLNRVIMDKVNQTEQDDFNKRTITTTVLKKQSLRSN